MTAGERALVLAAFSAALGFGMLLPLLPLYLSASASEQSWHAGVLPVVFLAGAALSAPLWGSLSDRLPRARVLIVALALSAGGVVPFLLQHSLGTLYLYQVMVGIAAGAVGPVTLALLYEAAEPLAHAQARGVARFSSATLAGYLGGPAIAGWIASFAVDESAHSAVTAALAFQGLLAAAAAVLVATSRVQVRPAAAPPAAQAPGTSTWDTLRAALLVAFAIGGFEVSTSLYVGSPLHTGARGVALVFTACSAGMIAAQLLVLPRLSPKVSRVGLALRCISVSGVLLAVMGFLQGHAVLIAFAAMQGAALGLAVGLLSFQAAAIGGGLRGSMLGYQNAAISAGQALGSAAGAASFLTLGVAAFPALGAAVLAAGALVRTRGK